MFILNPAADYAVRFLCGCQDTDPCPAGYKWSVCAYRCNRLCLDFLAVLRRDRDDEDLCPSTMSGCAPGCLPIGKDADTACPAGHYWRDEKTCVAQEDCNCRTPDGETIAPGSVVTKPGDCHVCQW